jgi:hypothetical protein
MPRNSTDGYSFRSAFTLAVEIGFHSKDTDFVALEQLLENICPLVLDHRMHCRNLEL